jgi:argininosuccinate synthase
MTDIIKPPPHYHIFWSATRARQFARILSGDPKRRSTYDQNIRLLNAAYSRIMETEADPRAFIKKVNPVLFAHALGMSPHFTQRVIGFRSYNTLYTMVKQSKCEHCRKLASFIRY